MTAESRNKFAVLFANNPESRLLQDNDIFITVIRPVSLCQRMSGNEPEYLRGTEASQ